MVSLTKVRSPVIFFRFFSCWAQRTLLGWPLLSFESGSPSDWTFTFWIHGHTAKDIAPQSLPQSQLADNHTLKQKRPKLDCADSDGIDSSNQNYILAMMRHWWEAMTWDWQLVTLTLDFIRQWRIRPEAAPLILFSTSSFKVNVSELVWYIDPFGTYGNELYFFFDMDFHINFHSLRSNRINVSDQPWYIDFKSWS